MKILHIIPGFEIRGGGGNRACAELCQSLAAFGHDVTVAHVGTKDEQCFAPENVTTRAFPPFLLRGYAYSPTLRRYLRSQIPKVDLVHLHATWQYPNVTAARCCKIRHVPYIVQPHGNLHPWKLAHKAWRKMGHWRLVEKNILKNAAFIHVESDTDEEDVRRLIPEAKTFISPCGAFSKLFEVKMFPDFIKEKWPCFKEKKCLLYLARVDVNKGIEHLLNAYAKVLRFHHNYNLLIVGPDYAGTTERMKKLAHELGIGNNVVWGGMVTDEDRIRIIQNCDIYVLPSLSENFGISVLEALFCSKPVLTTTETPWHELSGHKAGIITQANAESIHDGLLRLMGLDHDALVKMGVNGYNLAKSKYEWSSIAQSLIQKYQQAIKEN